jgi:hypothetical protein
MRTVLYVTARILPVSSHPTRWGQNAAFDRPSYDLLFYPKPVMSNLALVEAQHFVAMPLTARKLPAHPGQFTFINLLHELGA